MIPVFIYRLNSDCTSSIPCPFPWAFTSKSRLAGNYGTKAPEKKKTFLVKWHHAIHSLMLLLHSGALSSPEMSSRLSVMKLNCKLCRVQTNILRLKITEYIQHYLFREKSQISKIKVVNLWETKRGYSLINSGFQFHVSPWRCEQRRPSRGWNGSGYPCVQLSWRPRPDWGQQEEVC